MAPESIASKITGFEPFCSATDRPRFSSSATFRICAVPRTDAQFGTPMTMSSATAAPAPAESATAATSVLNLSCIFLPPFACCISVTFLVMPPEAVQTSSRFRAWQRQWTPPPPSVNIDMSGS